MLNVARKFVFELFEKREVNNQIKVTNSKTTQVIILAALP